MILLGGHGETIPHKPPGLPQSPMHVFLSKNTPLSRWHDLMIQLELIIFPEIHVNMKILFLRGLHRI
jgi:hypothetical protein